MNLKKCPYCGFGTYYTKAIVKGEVWHRYNFDGSEADNVSLYDGLDHKFKSKYAFCDECHKKLFKISDIGLNQ